MKPAKRDPSVGSSGRPTTANDLQRLEKKLRREINEKTEKTVAELWAPYAAALITTCGTLIGPVGHPPATAPVTTAAKPSPDSKTGIGVDLTERYSFAYPKPDPVLLLIQGIFERGNSSLLAGQGLEAVGQNMLVELRSLRAEQTEDTHKVAVDAAIRSAERIMQKKAIPWLGLQIEE